LAPEVPCQTGPVLDAPLHCPEAAGGCRTCGPVGGYVLAGTGQHILVVRPMGTANAPILFLILGAALARRSMVWVETSGVADPGAALGGPGWPRTMARTNSEGAARERDWADTPAHSQSAPLCVTASSHASAAHTIAHQTHPRDTHTHTLPPHTPFDPLDSSQALPRMRECASLRWSHEEGWA
jgi:hypothetical protein